MPRPRLYYRLTAKLIEVVIGTRNVLGERAHQLAVEEIASDKVERITRIS